MLVWWLAPPRSRWQGAGVACLCLALGGIAGELLVSKRNHALRGELLQRCRHLAAGLDRGDLAAHRNLPEDIGQPWGVRIHTRLLEARKSDPEVTYAYLMEHVGPAIVFPNGDDEPGTPDFTPLGTAYADIPPEMRQAVIEGRDFSLGPYVDHWGEFISVGTPVELSDQRRMTVALDVRAARWRTELLVWRLWPIAIGAAMAFVAVLLWSRGRALAATRVAVREAEAANHAKDAYLATVSHDLRNPLSGIIGMTGLLADSELTAQQREYVQLAHNSGQQLLTLVNELLDYARIEAGELALDRVQCPLRELVEDSVALLAPLATAKDVELNAIIERDVPEALIGDPDRIRQILHNLVGNAVKFTDEGEVVVRVTAGADAASGRVRLRIAVRDTGIGIDAATISRLFQPFAQGSDAGRRRGGTGLGLCIAQRIARALGGDVTVESTPGAGSTFTAVLLLDPDPQSPAVDGISSMRRGSRVLLGVVQPSLREGMSEALVALGLEPVVAADVMTAMAIVATAPPPAAAVIEAGWARDMLPALEAAGIPVGVVSARSAGGTQMLASRRTPVLLRPVRRESLLRLLGNLWGTRSSSTRRFAAVASGVEAGVAPRTPATTPVARSEDDYAPSVVDPPSPPAPALPPIATLAGGLLGGLRSGIDAVRDAARSGDLGTVRRAAQGLRSAAEPLRLTELADTCIALEVAASGGDQATVRDIAINLDDVRRRTQQAISEISRKQAGR